MLGEIIESGNGAGSLFLGTLLAIFIGRFIYLKYYSPLSWAPGPNEALLIPGWILYITWSEQRNRGVHKLHAKYGPVVRVAPNELSVTDPGLVKIIYNGNYDKSQFYGQFTNFGRPNMFSSLKKNDHLARRKIVTKAYSKSSVFSPASAAMIEERVENLMTHFDTNATNSKTCPIDVTLLFHELAMDTVTGFFFGDSYGTQYLKGNQQEASDTIEDFRQQSSTWFWTTLMPQFWNLAVSKEVKSHSERAQKFILSYLKTPVEYGIWKQFHDSGITGIDALSEAHDHVAAGHETTGVNLSYFAYHLSMHPEIQDRLYEELKQQPQPMTVEQVDALPYLNGCMQETLRLYTPIPGQEPRVVPKAGCAYGKNVIPGGTVISAQPWSLHRMADAFPKPLKFIPERWIDPKPEDLIRMNNNFTAFGKGVRMCIGMNVAVAEMKLAMANLYLKYKSSVPENFNHDWMIQADKYTTHAQGHYCPLVFEARPGAV